MALAVFNESQQGAAFVIIIVCTPIAILATILRFVATSRSRRKLGWEDFFASLALLINLAYNAMLMWSKAFPVLCGDSHEEKGLT